MEEPLIEAFSRIIINHKYGRELKIKETCIEEINNPENPYDLKIAFNLIYYMNLDTIKWFILSSYDDEYRNRLKEIFNENYGLLLDYFASPKESYNEALNLIHLTLKKND